MKKKTILSVIMLVCMMLFMVSCGKEKEEDLTSLEVAVRMGNGINLGNTMEAYGRSELGTGAEISQYETYWGQPVTTQEMIDSMKNAGFDSLRIPVAWTNGMDYETGDYTIRKDLLDRVEEIVQYAIKNDMYVIINDHWDGGWWGMFGSAQQETRDAAMELYVSMWTQIAERFKDYSNLVIFESANEELGNRLNDIDICKDSGSLSEDECYEMTTLINQTFVDTIRGSGGKNEQRFLLIAGYNTDIEATCDERYVMPVDTANDKLMISVHYYTPWSYCGSKSVTQWGRIKDYEEQNRLLKMMTKFTEQGYGVVIGEYAVLIHEDGEIKDNTTDFYYNFLDNCDLYGFVPMLWDCSNAFIRTELSFFDSDVAEVFSSRSLKAQGDLKEEEIQERAKSSMQIALAEAPEKFDDTIDLDSLDGAVAWLMYTSQDWSISYSVGDVYDPEAKADGLAASDVVVTGEGTYTVSLDLTGCGEGFATGMTFAAVAISNGELLYPDYIIEIKEVLINGEPYKLKGRPYTSSDDEKCTRVNLYNEWVKEVPEEARITGGNMTGASAMLLDNEDLSQIETIDVTFEYKAP